MSLYYAILNNERRHYLHFGLTRVVALFCLRTFTSNYLFTTCTTFGDLLGAKLLSPS